MYTRSLQQHKGFSLIEVLVSLSIFTIVVTICVTVLYTLIDANARTRNAQSIVTNLSFTLDSITREIRTGKDYFCTDSLSALPVKTDADPNPNVSDCAGGGDYLAFNEGGQSLTKDTPNDSRRIAMRLSDDGKLQRRLGNGDGTIDADEDTDWIDLTSDGVTVEELKFFVTGTEPAGENDANPNIEPPAVILYLSGTIGDEEANETEFQIQTTITQYSLDL